MQTPKDPLAELGNIFYLNKDVILWKYEDGIRAIAQKGSAVRVASIMPDQEPIINFPFLRVTHIFAWKDLTREEPICSHCKQSIAPKDLIYSLPKNEDRETRTDI